MADDSQDAVQAEATDLTSDFVALGKEAVAKELEPLRAYAAQTGKAEMAVVGRAIEAVTSRLLGHIVGALHPTGLDAVVVSVSDAKAADAKALEAANAQAEASAALEAAPPVASSPEVEKVEEAVDPVLEKINAEVEALTGAGQ